MQNLIIVLLTCSVTMSVLALFYMAVTPVLARRYSSKSRYYVWLMIVIGFLIPFRPHFDIPFIKSIPADIIIPDVPLNNGYRLVKQVGGFLQPSFYPYSSLTWWQIVALIWLTGMVVFVFYHMTKYLRFMKMTGRFSEVITDEETIRIFQFIKAGSGISKDIGFYKCMSVGTPMLTGFIHPKILLPDLKFEEEDLCLILKHELIHYKRKDLWYKLMVLSASAVHWFNPLMRLMAEAIDAQCEISCDTEVIGFTDTDTRLRYCEAIIGVVKHQSNTKTMLSTNFYGGKKAMKKRISSIMDIHNKKSGIVILCCGLIFIMGTGFTYAAKPETNHKQDYTKEDIQISPDFAYDCKFLPDPGLYVKYSSYGIAVSDDGKTLLYNGQKVRLFADEYSDAMADSFYYDNEGTVNLTASRDSSGKITGINTISEEAAQKIYFAFFADEAVNGTGTNTAKGDSTSDAGTSVTKYEQYLPYGITFIAEENSVYFNGKRVRMLVDDVDESDGFDTFWVDEAGAVDLAVVRNAAGQITQIDTLSNKKAQDYITAASQYEKDVLTGLEAKVEKRLKELYPEN